MRVFSILSSSFFLFKTFKAAVFTIELSVRTMYALFPSVALAGRSGTSMLFMSFSKFLVNPFVKKTGLKLVT
jgi:hypothetical protein